ncbi:MAG: hypothetical protein DI535_21160 [Citrobacter freundii]|nr:MAG: hypothetical protein DI535_21160 [Citrobacter freundii]
MKQEIYDLCVIGTGPAGIIAALEFARNNPEKKVLLIEYGSEKKNGKNKLDDSIHIDNPVNHHGPYECTNKGLGGTSATWGGRCVMYNDIDFIPRPVVGNGCTWDLELFTETKKYLAKAAEYFECGEPAFDIREMTKGPQTPIAENFVNGDVIDTALERWSSPTRFGSRYKAEITSLANLDLVYDMEARDFGTPVGTGTVKELTLRHTQTGTQHIIKSKFFILAAGAQETTRILLRNPQLFDKLGSPPRALGRYYQSHVSGKIASVKFYGDPRKTDYGFLRDKDNIYLRRRFQFADEYLAKNDLLNVAIWLDNPLYHDPAHKSGAMSFMYLAMITPVLGKKLAPPAIAESITKGKVNKLGSHFLNVLKGLPGSLVIPARIFFKRYIGKRKLPGVFLYSAANRYALHFHAEQTPIEENAMRLGPDRQSLYISYKLDPRDIHSIIKTHQKLDEWLRQCNCGELEYWYPENELYAAIERISKDGIHQSGTTRIADSADEGVVDRDLLLFGTDNVYICSSSVFPTSSQANPTFFIGCMAARLADHIKTKMG